MSEAIRVLIVDDHAVVREGLRTFLSTQDDIEIVGEASDGREAMGVASRVAPDVVLSDLVMPNMGGVELIEALKAAGSPARVIVLTSFLDDDKVFPAVRAGAAGYLLKDASPLQVADAIRTAHRGEALLDPGVAAKLVAGYAEASGGTPSVRAASLTPREREVLAGIADGKSNRQIARALRVAEKTVKTHVSSILSKLGVEDRTQAALLAVREGLTDESSGTGFR